MLTMIDLSQDIQSLSTFKRNSNDTLERMKITGNPLVLTVNGKAELVVQDVAAYQKLLDKIKYLEALATQTKQSQQDLELLNLYGVAADIEFVLDFRKKVIDNPLNLSRAAR